MSSRRKVFLKSSTFSSWEGESKDFAFSGQKHSVRQGESWWSAGPGIVGISCEALGLWSLPHPLPRITRGSTLAFSPEQGQSAARIQEFNTAIPEQGFELGMKEREVSI